MENTLIYILAFSAMAIALFACILPQQSFDTLPTNADFIINTDGSNYWATAANGTNYYTSTNCSYTANSVTANLRSTGGLILFAEGKYYFDTPLLVSEGLSFEGTGKTYTSTMGTCLSLSQWANCSLITAYNLTAANNDISFSGISFYGQGAVQSQGDLIYFQKCNFLVFRDCGFYDSYRDLMRFETGVAQQVTIDNCWFQGSFHGSCLYSTTMTDSVVQKSMFAPLKTGSYQGTHALYITSSKIIFVANTITSSYGNGVYYSGQQCTFENNEIHTNRLQGVAFENALVSIFNGNRVYQNGQYGAGSYSGMDIYGTSSNCTISNNLFYDTQATRTQLRGIRIRSTTSYIIVTSNNCFGNTGAQILQEDATSEIHSCFNGTNWIT